MLKCLFLAILMLIPGNFAWSQEPPQTPKIKSQQQPESGLKAQKYSTQQPQGAPQPSPRIPEIISEGTNREGQSKLNEGGDQGTEFWTPLDGYRLKITDTLLVAVTFLLFIATLALWLATRNLVASAEKTAHRLEQPYLFLHDLRPLLFPTGAHALYPATSDAPWPRIWYSFKNLGRTPAIVKQVRTELLIGEVPPTIFEFIDPKGMRGENVVAKDAITEIYPSIFPRHLTPDEIQQLKSAQIHFFLIGNALYSDMFGQAHEYGFCIQFLPERGGGFVVTGGSKYNYRSTKKNPDEKFSE